MSHKRFMGFLRRAVMAWEKEGIEYEKEAGPITAAEWNDLFMLELYEQTKDGRRP